MALVAFVATLALLEYMVFAGFVGWARGRYEVPAPAISGHPEFERYFRVHQNTLEQLIVFIPSLFLFGQFVSELWAAGLGGAFIAGRALYFLGYVRDPAKRTAGFLIGYLANVGLLVGGLIGTVRTLL